MAAEGERELSWLLGVEIAGAAGRADRYRIGRAIGKGTQAIVFRARRIAAAGDCPVVVKVWRPSFAYAHPELAGLVLRKESAALTQLNEQVPPSPFVVRLLDAGELAPPVGAPLPWLALEHVNGGPLGSNLEERMEESIEASGTAFPPRRARRAIGCLVQGLAAIHACGMVHRDLKPKNVLACGSGDDELLKVADLGVARESGMQGTFGVGAEVGTAGYAAPEQRNNRQIGPWSDVFSLAAITYFMIAGEPMFGGSAPLAMASAFRGSFEPLRTRSRAHPSWHAGGALDAIDEVLRRAVVRRTTMRTPSAQAFWAEIEPLLLGAQMAPSVSLRPRAEGPEVSTLARAASRPWTFRASRTPPSDLSLRTAAFDPDGHAMAASASGLWYWEGSCWMPVAPPPGIDATRIRVLHRIGPARWLCAGDGGEVSVFTPYGCVARQVIEGAPSLTAACVLSERAFALSGKTESGSALLVANLGGRWTPPLLLDPGVHVAALGHAGRSAFHVVGEDAQGRGLLWTWLADSGAIERRAPLPAPLRAVVVGNETLCAVGDRGLSAVLSKGSVTCHSLPTQPDLRFAAMDPAGGIWAAADGQLVRRNGQDPRAEWTAVWAAEGAPRQVAGIGAFAGIVLVATRDGTVVTGEQIG